jgi:hypothetical protein
MPAAVWLAVGHAHRTGTRREKPVDRLLLAYGFWAIRDWHVERPWYVLLATLK